MTTGQARGRAPVYAAHGVAATASPAASSAAIAVLQAGGNAVDAALAASAVLCVTAPHATGAGGDGFAQVIEPDGAVVAYNAGGLAGAGARPDRYPDGVPGDGLSAACIPGLPDCWALMHERQASLPLARLLAPAIDLAAEGMPVSRELAQHLARSRDRLARFPATAAIFLPHGDPPVAGQRLVQADLARTLQRFADGGRDAFYDGATAEALAQAFARDADGLINRDDLRAHTAEAAEPLRASYRGYTISEQPPASQGHLLLQQLLMLERFDLAALGHLSADALHAMIEVKKLAFADRTTWAGDPRFVELDLAALLSPQRAAERIAAIDPARAQVPSGSASKPTDTTQFVVGDSQGRAVSFIQSVYHSFGCAAVAPGTGLLLNNRMLGFSPEPDTPNVMAPGKRTVHTLNTYAVFRDGEFLLCGGTPGADFQVQTNLQILTGLLDHGLDLLAAVDAPRWGHIDGRRVLLESRLPAATVDELRRRGHEIRVGGAWESPLGCAMLLARAENGWIAVADQRREGSVAGF